MLYGYGWNVIPVMQKSKAPTIGWTEWQTNRIPYEKLEEWFGTGEPGIGVVCGQVSNGLAVLDFDTFEAYGRWTKANPDLATSLPSARSGRGFHIFFRSVDYLPSGQFRLIGETEPVGDILSEKKLCILPPTLHPKSGRPRTWVREPGETVPTATLDQLGVETFRVEKPTIRIDQTMPVLEGQRHGFLVSMAGKLRNLGMGNWSLEASLLGLNRERCDPPLEEPEVKEIATWAAKTEIHSPYTRENEEPWETDVPHDNEPIGNDEDSPYAGMFLSLSEYLDQSASTDVEWLVEGFLPVGYLVVVGGLSKSGKSCLMTDLALCLAEGRDFLGMPVEQGPVLWCALEESESERRIALEAYDVRPDPLYTSHSKIRIDKPEGIEALRYWVRKTGAKLVVIDPLYAAHSAESLSDGSAARRVLQPLKDLCRTEGISVIVLHHLTKGTSQGMVRERMADSNQILASASMDMLLDSSEMGDGSRELVLHCRGRGEFANQVWVLRSERMGRYELLRHGRDAGKGSEATDATILEALRAMDGATAESLAESTGITVGTVRNRLIELRKKEAVYQDGKQGRSNLDRAA